MDLAFRGLPQMTLHPNPQDISWMNGPSIRPSRPYSVRQRVFWRMFSILCVLAVVVGGLIAINI